MGSADFRQNAITGDFHFLADFDLSPKWQLTANAGAGYYEDGGNNTYETVLLAFTLGYSPNDVVNYFIDTGIQGSEARHGHTAEVVDIGLAYIIGKKTQLDFSVGNGVAGQSSPHPFVMFGFSYRLN